MGVSPSPSQPKSGFFFWVRGEGDPGGHQTALLHRGRGRG